MINRKVTACSARLNHSKYFESPEKKSCEPAILNTCLNEPVRLTITLNDIINSTKNINSVVSARSDSSRESNSRPRTARTIRTPARSSSKPTNGPLKSARSTSKPQQVIKKQSTSHIKPIEALISQKYNCKVKLSELRQIKFIPNSVMVIENNSIQVYSIRRV